MGVPARKPAKDEKRSGATFAQPVGPGKAMQPGAGKAAKEAAKATREKNKAAKAALKAGKAKDEGGGGGAVVAAAAAEQHRGAAGEHHVTSSEFAGVGGLEAQDTKAELDPDSSPWKFTTSGKKK